MCDKKTPDLVEYYKEKSRKGDSLILIFSDGMEHTIRLNNISDKWSQDKNNNMPGYEPPKVRERYVFRMPTPVLDSAPSTAPEDVGCYSTPTKSVTKVKKGKKRIKSHPSSPNSRPNSKDVSRPSANPLEIDLVINDVFGYVKKKDLPACRQVCKNWNVKLIPRFRDEFEIYVCTIDHSKLTKQTRRTPYYNRPPKPEEDCKPGKNHKSLESFVKLMRTSTCIPFTKFRLDLNNKVKWSTEFFRVCGPLITHVTLGNYTSQWDPYFWDTHERVLIENLKEMFKFSRNLESLCFKTPIYYNKKKFKFFDEPEVNLPALEILSFNRHNCPPTLVDELIANSPKLVDVEFKNSSSPWPNTGDVLSALLPPHRKSTIKNLTTEPFRITKGFVDKVEKRRFKLKKLHVNGSEEFVNHEHLYRLIKSQKDNLCEFNCNLSSSGWSGQVPTQEFPGMKNLKILNIRLQYSRIFTLRCTEQPFCEKFPNVEIMSFYNGYADLNLDFLGSQCCPKLKSLQLSFYTLDLPGFQNMTEVYSSSALTSLKLDIGRFKNSKILTLIWTNLKNLQELELIFSYKNMKVGDLDSIFTGISAEDCKRIKENPDYWNFMNTKGKKLRKRNKLAELAYQLRVSPSIADLKSLRRLSLIFPGIGLTNITGYLGLYELENMKHIHIDFCEFSKTCCESLMNQMNLESWVFREKHRWYEERYTGGYLVPIGPGIYEVGANKDIVPPYFYPYKEMERFGIRETTSPFFN